MLFELLLKNIWASTFALVSVTLCKGSLFWSDSLFNHMIIKSLLVPETCSSYWIGLKHPLNVSQLQLTTLYVFAESALHRRRYGWTCLTAGSAFYDSVEDWADAKEEKIGWVERGQWIHYSSCQFVLVSFLELNIQNRYILRQANYRSASIFRLT